MASIKVHGVPLSTTTCRVLACLYEKDLEFDFVHVNMRDHQWQSRGTSPEIMLLMEPIPQDLRKAGMLLTWIEVESHHFDPQATKLVVELCSKPVLGWGETDSAVVEQSEAELAKVLDIYESKLAQSKYLAVETFTLADLHHLPTLSFLLATQSKKLFESRPHVNAWVTEIMARPAWAKVLPDH